MGALAGCSAQPQIAVRGDVVAAGQPAALLIWAVARERLAGWPRRPAADCLATLPEMASRLPELGSLSGVGQAANLETIAALSPSRIIDYGDLDPKYQALSEQFKARLGVDWTLIDGALRHIPEALRQAARLLGTELQCSLWPIRLRVFWSHGPRPRRAPVSSMRAAMTDWKQAFAEPWRQRFWKGQAGPTWPSAATTSVG